MHPDILAPIERELRRRSRPESLRPNDVNPVRAQHSPSPGAISRHHVLQAAPHPGSELDSADAAARNTRFPADLPGRGIPERQAHRAWRLPIGTPSTGTIRAARSKRKPGGEHDHGQPSSVHHADMTPTRSIRFPKLQSDSRRTADSFDSEHARNDLRRSSLGRLVTSSSCQTESHG